MRLVSFMSAAALALVLSGPVHAQAWGEFVDRAEFFTVNMPGDPKVESIQHRTEKGTMLPAKVYTAQDARGGNYKVTVVDYTNAQDEQATAMEEAAKVIRAKGEVKYDNNENLDRMRDHRISVMLPNERQLLALILLSRAGRLYILEADTPLNTPPPAQFQASLQVLDEEGVRIRYNPDGVTRQR